MGVLWTGVCVSDVRPYVSAYERRLTRDESGEGCVYGGLLWGCGVLWCTKVWYSKAESGITMYGVCGS